eukprot:1140635-Pelagomonas_calceolata.AAC.6
MQAHGHKPAQPASHMATRMCGMQAGAGPAANPSSVHAPDGSAHALELLYTSLISPKAPVWFSAGEIQAEGNGQGA